MKIVWMIVSILLAISATGGFAQHNTRVTGVVTTGTDDAPVSGALVFAAEDTRIRTFTDADGRFVIEDVRLPSVHLAAQKDPLVSDVTLKTPLWVDLEAGKDNGPVHLKLVPGLTLEGTVFDAKTGNPIRHATVQVVHPEFSGRTETDDGGHYRLGGLFAIAHWIAASKDGYVASSESQTPAIGAENHTDFQLSPGGKQMSLTVYDEEGRPLPGVTVGSCCWDVPHPVNLAGRTTDANGHIILLGIPTGPSAGLVATKEGYEDGFPSMEYPDGTVDRVTSLTLTKYGLEGVTRGHVRDEQGNPMVGVSVYLADPNISGPDVFHQATTGLDGSYVLRVPIGEGSHLPNLLLVYAYSPGFAVEARFYAPKAVADKMYSWRPEMAMAVQETETQKPSTQEPEPVEMDFVLRKGITATVKVQDKKRNPISLARVVPEYASRKIDEKFTGAFSEYTTNPIPGLPHGLLTDADGMVKFKNLPEDPMIIMVYKYGYSSVDHVPLKPGKTLTVTLSE